MAESLFTSVARYGIAVYFKPRLHNDPKCAQQDQLQVIQNKMLRLLSGKKIKDRVRVERLAKDFNQMSMNQMSSYHVLLETYSIINYSLSKQIREKLLSLNPNSTHLRVPLVKEDSCRSFSFYAARLWNILPLSIRIKGMPKTGLDQKAETARLNSFKSEIKGWILGKQNKNGSIQTLPGVPFR